MPLPNTYLSVAPIDLTGMCGTELMSVDIIRGLRRINPLITAETPSGLSATCLWLGEPKVGKKIAVFRAGAVPEFTQLGTGGTWMVRGWRSIFAKVIATRAATARQIERQFRVVLETDGRDGSCVACRREGTLRRAEANGKRLCSDHQEVNDNVESGERKRKFLRDMSDRLTSRRHQGRATKEIEQCLSSV